MQKTSQRTLPRQSATRLKARAKKPTAATEQRPRTTRSKTAPARKPAPRADYGLPVDGFFAKQPPGLRPILDELRKLVKKAAPEATASLKWGMPFYAIGDNMLCALAGFKAHVNLILPGPPGTYADPDDLLEGGGKTGKHLKVRALGELPKSRVSGWLRTAAERAKNP